MPTPTQVLRQDVDNLNAKVDSLIDKIDKLFPMGPEKHLAVAAIPTSNLPESFVKEFGESDPVPVDYRKAVDQILNPGFGIHSKAHTDAAQFTFTVVVPEKYSGFTPEQKAMLHADLRSRVITYGEGLAGLKEWLDIVWKSFNPDVQAQITADRLSTNA